MDALKKRNIDKGDGTCVLCGDQDESVEHLFTACGVASTIWSVVSLWCKIPHILAFSVKDLLEAHEVGSLKGRKKDLIQGIVRIGCWCIWKARNEVKFNNKEVKIEGIVRELKSLGFFWYNARSRGNEVSWSEWRKFVNM
ncbi:uncharacterized protein LOC110902028 [Helianthus annuus]|uniref:uncharacterized protein LOC110902028 n=1 Tax=Helianthus annuus TaxID=4232 RepID=UPI000B90373A|nr:uncharacterized protein LOC110902028 [Helianthus annuus]